MAKANMFALVFVFGILLKDVSSTSIESSGELFDTLLARIESLEASDAANKAKIAEMESEFKIELDLNKREISDLKVKMDEMESSFRQNEANMLGEINELKTSVAATKDDNAGQQHGDGNEDIERPIPVPNRIQRQGNNFRQDRGVPETEVAFYATHPTTQIHHVGTNQILQFPLALTNIGNAFNNNTGGFTAPVDGTYVLHATIMAIDTTSHVRAHFDINGISYSVFYVTDLDQSSQMLIIDLKAGQTATIKNDFSETGYHGNHHSAFSGFLLYQKYPSGQIVGK